MHPFGILCLIDLSKQPEPLFRQQLIHFFYWCTMETSNTNVPFKKPQLPSFYPNSFDRTKSTIKKSDILQHFLITKEPSSHVKALFNILAQDAAHTHYGLFASNGCILISDLADMLLKDEKTIKNHIKEMKSFFDQNEIRITPSFKNHSSEIKTASCEHKIFDDIRIVKTERGVALSYRFSSVGSQLVKTELEAKHFFKLYCVKHGLTSAQSEELKSKGLEVYLYSLLHVYSLMPNFLVHKIFNLSPDDLLKLSKNKTTSVGFTDSELREIHTAASIFNGLEGCDLKKDSIFMESWIDIALSKDSQSNFYYHVFAKLINNLRSKYGNRKAKHHTFEMRISTVRMLLKRLSKNYDNTAVKSYLRETVEAINEKTDLIVAVKEKPNTQGSNLTFSVLVAKKPAEQIEIARNRLKNEKKTKVLDYVTVQYEYVRTRNLVSKNFFHLDQNDNLAVVNYVLFDDLIANPLKPLDDTQNASKPASNAPVSANAGESVGRHQKSENTATEQANSAPLIPVDEIAIRQQFNSFKFDKVFNTLKDAYQLQFALPKYVKRADLAFKFSIKDRKLRDIAIDSQFVSSSEDCIFVHRNAIKGIKPERNAFISIEVLWKGQTVVVDRKSVNDLRALSLRHILGLNDYCSTRLTHTYNTGMQFDSEFVYLENGAAKIHFSAFDVDEFSFTIEAQSKEGETTLLLESIKKKSESTLTLDLHQIANALQIGRGSGKNVYAVFKSQNRADKMNLLMFLYKCRKGS